VIVFDPKYGDMIARSAGTHFNPISDVVIARLKDGELLGGVIYTGYTGASVAMHVAGFDPKWINPDMLWICFDYAFNQLKVNKIFGQVPANNKRALEFDLKLGFIEVARIADVFPDGDLLVMAMSREQCRWLRLKPRRMESKNGR
jgi:RimJ/RimL family protein N-acetyltransferase